MLLLALVLALLLLTFTLAGPGARPARPRGAGAPAPALRPPPPSSSATLARLIGLLFAALRRAAGHGERLDGAAVAAVARLPAIGRRLLSAPAPPRLPDS